MKSDAKSESQDVIRPASYSAQDARWAPRVTVATIVPHENRFLFVEERVRGQLVINQPAGHLEPNESLVEAAVRETREEAGCEIAPQALVGIYRWDAPSGRTFLRTTVIGELLSQNKTAQLDAGIERALWLSLEELQNEQARLRTPLVLKSLQDYIAGQRFSLDVLCEYSPDNAG